VRNEFGGNAGKATRVRCAIYTRKSTEEVLDQDFNSLDAQREAAAAYITSQKHLGWTLVSGRNPTDLICQRGAIHANRELSIYVISGRFEAGEADQ
jgi:hypothetical protein